VARLLFGSSMNIQAPPNLTPGTSTLLARDAALFSES